MILLVIMHQTSILDLLLSFAALETVTAFDDVVFGLMKREFVGERRFKKQPWWKTQHFMHL